MLLARCLPFLAALALFPGCKPKQDAPKDADIRASLQSAFPTFEVIDLKTEVAPRPEPGIVEIACKVTVKFREDHFVLAFKRSEDVFSDGPAVGFTAECVKRGVLPPAANIAIDSRERVPDNELQNTVRPRFEATGEPTLLKVKNAGGAKVEIYGTMLAKKFVDRWDFAPFQAKDDIDAFGKPRSGFEGRTLVMDRPEYEEAVKAIAAVVKTRQAAIEARDAKWNAAMAAPATFCGTHVERPVKIAIAPVSDDLVKIEVTSLRGKAIVRSATVPRRAAAAPKEFNQDAQVYYRAVPTAPVMQPLKFTNDYSFGGDGVFSHSGNSAFDGVYFFGIDAAGKPRLVQGGRDQLKDVRECTADTASVSDQPAPAITTATRSERAAVAAAPQVAPPAPAQVAATQNVPTAAAPSAATLAKTARAHAIIQRRAPGTPADAIKLYGEAAVEGDPDAMVNFAHLLRSGKYGFRDLEMAKKLYRRAGDAGNVEAKLALETLERTGR